MGTFTGKVAIVTGAGSGIGEALGKELASRGATVVLSDIDEQRINDVVKTIQGKGQKAGAVVLDVSDYDATKQMIEDAVAENGQLDYIFNNAGIAVGGEVRDCAIEDWRNVLDVNLYGVINGVQVAYPIMVKQGFGHIINTGSIEGLIPFPNTTSYVASKYAVVGLSESLRIEGADLGVKVSVVCPGFIKTRIFTDSKMINVDEEKMLEGLTEMKGFTSEQCAMVILDGVVKNKAFIPVTRFAKIFWTLHRINPRIVHWLMRKSIRRSRLEVRIEDKPGVNK
jgi:NADP-dependent 3-hydroxy acid dehydrogenase YdfG